MLKQVYRQKEESRIVMLCGTFGLLPSLTIMLQGSTNAKPCFCILVIVALVGVIVSKFVFYADRKVVSTECNRVSLLLHPWGIGLWVIWIIKGWV